MNVINDLIDLYGDIPAMRFTSDDLDYFADELRHIPAAMTRAERALPFLSRVELGEDKARPKCKPATPAKKLTLLKAILAYALHKRVITYNPAQKLETGHSYKANARRQFTNSEVTKLFSLPIFFDPKTWHFDLAISSSTVAWVGLIGLMSGSRLGEIPQAHVDDVLQDEGHVALSIRSEDDENLPRSVKTPGSERVIVLHPRIISLGFLDYLKAVKASGSTLVFPDVARVEGGLRSKEVSRRLNALVDEVIERPEVVFHSLRHTFKARARQAGVNPDIERQFTGHVPPDVSGQYGLAFITQLAEELSKIEFPMVPWDRISEAWTEVDWTQVVDRIRKDSPEVS